MKNLIVSIATLALVAGSATVSSAATKDAPVVRKTLVNSCDTPVKSAKLTKPVVQNRCGSNGLRNVGVVPLVFGGAIVAGIVAIEVTNNNNNNNSTSP